ncbi:hypothetical protein QQF64_015405 [Cirrhinus molitorella]|uniref:Uncharacterized protein n=1 Tax=Cirrhinus molitorella TaxID=172907 RepID=A0ABR3NV75_9TELE
MVTVVNLGKGNKRKERVARGSIIDQLPKRLSRQKQLRCSSQDSRAQPVHLILCDGWLCGYARFVPSLLGVPAPRPDGNVSSGEKLLSAIETPSTTRRTAWTSATFNRSVCLSKNAYGLRLTSMARSMSPRGEKSRGKSDRGP